MRRTVGRNRQCLRGRITAANFISLAGGAKFLPMRQRGMVDLQ